MISVDELKHALSETEMHMSDEDITKMFDNVDYAGNKKINYSEFISATLSVQQVLTQEKLIQLFKHFDVDNSDYITPENLKQAFAQAGKILTDGDIKQILKEHDIVGDGRLSFDEFKEIFYDENEEGADKLKLNAQYSEVRKTEKGSLVEPNTGLP